MPLILTISYGGIFEDSEPVHIKKLKSLTPVNKADINISNTSTSQTLNVLGNFENNESNISLEGNIEWTGDGNITINEQNSSSVTFTVLDQNISSVVLTASIFINTSNQADFNISIP